MAPLACTLGGCVMAGEVRANPPAHAGPVLLGNPHHRHQDDRRHRERVGGVELDQTTLFGGDERTACLNRGDGRCILNDLREERFEQAPHRAVLRRVE